MGAIDLVVLDCDGVLVDSERLIIEVESRLITELGWPITPEEVVERFVGRDGASMLAEVEAKVGRALPEWPGRYRAAAEAAFRADLVAVPGIVAALDELDRRGVRTCVASSGTHEKMQLTLGLTGLHERFDGRIHSATEVGRGKPAPDLFLHAADRMGVAPQRCVVVEDSVPGVDAALAAGMACLAYGAGVTPPERLARPGVHVFGDMAELPDLVADLDRAA